MTPGDRVMIYEDPVTQKRPEGRGRLVKKLEGINGLFKSRGNQEYWLVRFMDGMECWRWIKVEENER